MFTYHDLIVFILFNLSDTIANGIADLLTYANEFQADLDVDYMQARIYELLGWIIKLESDVKSLSENSSMTVCDATCPNSLWNYNPDACSCTCDVKNCLIPDTVIDYFNCRCVPAGDCAKTKDSCFAQGEKILDYSACECKVAP